MFCGPHNNYCGAGVAPAYTSDAGMGMTMNQGIDTTGCNGQVIQSGSKTEYVDCPTTRAVPETYVVPRTVTGSRLETRTRMRNEMRTRVVPITKFRNETKMVPVQRQVAYKDYKTETYTVPKTENYTVTLPTTRVVNETRTRTKVIPGTKKCPVRVPVYSATCNAANAGTSAMPTTYDSGFNTGMPMDTSLGMDTTLGTFDSGAMNLGTALPADGAILGDTYNGLPRIDAPGMQVRMPETSYDATTGIDTTNQSSGWGQWSPWSNPQPISS